MGEDILPADPSGPCPGCCDELPSSLHMMVTITENGTRVYSGIIYQQEERPCVFRGDLYDPEERHLGGGIEFCFDGTDIVMMGCHLHPACLEQEATVIHTGCFPIVWGVSPSGKITYHAA